MQEWHARDATALKMGSIPFFPHKKSRFHRSSIDGEVKNCHHHRP